MDEGRAVDIAYCTASCKILIKQLLMYGSDKQKVRSVGNWLNGQAQSSMISSMKSSGRSVNGKVHQGSLLHPFNSTSSLMIWMKGKVYLQPVWQ